MVVGNHDGMTMLSDFLKRLLPSGRATSGPSAKEMSDGLIAEGNRAEDAGRLQEACERYREAVRIAPDYAKAHLNLGIGLEAAGAAEDAARSYEAALAIDPAEPYACYNFGKLLYARRETARAEQLLRAAVERKPRFPQAHVVLSNIYDTQGNLPAAAAALETALDQQPDLAGPWYNYGDVLLKLGKRAESQAALRRALAIDPGYALASQLLGNILRGESRIGEALEVFRSARRISPDRFDLDSSELYTLNFSEETSDAALAASHRAFGERLERAFPARFAPFRNSRDPQRRLRIGYVSGDLHYHVVALFMIPVLERHNRSAFEVYCYSTGSKVDEYTQRLSQHVDVWRPAAALSRTELANTINRDGIDILVDLAGHSGAPQLEVFAQQPAPVQATWLGYQNTTGLTRIQYRLCDACTDPPGEVEHLSSETLVRLPHSVWCYRPVLSIDHATEPPCKRNGFVTFGSFNDAPKISGATRRLWSEILVRLPNARLVVVGVPEGYAKERMLLDCAEAGIAATRINIAPRVPLDQYLRWFDAVDISLDTTPYSGHTTTCDTLWMGVPVITLSGTRSVSRGAASILTTAGLTEWIAPSAEEYVRRAVELAGKPEVLAGLRASLRGRLRASPLMDEPGFVRDLESAYRRMWSQWCEDSDR